MSITTRMTTCPFRKIESVQSVQVNNDATKHDFQLGTNARVVPTRKVQETRTIAGLYRLYRLETPCEGEQTLTSSPA